MFVPVSKSFSIIDAKIDADGANNFFVSADVNGANILTVSADADAVNILCWRAHHCLCCHIPVDQSVAVSALLNLFLLLIIMPLKQRFYSSSKSKLIKSLLPPFRQRLGALFDEIARNAQWSIDDVTKKRSNVLLPSPRKTSAVSVINSRIESSF